MCPDAVDERDAAVDRRDVAEFAGLSDSEAPDGADGVSRAGIRQELTFREI